jgi:hypothetical protein
VSTFSTLTSATTASALSSVNNVNVNDRIGTIISKHKESIKKSHISVKSLTKNELVNLIKRICEEISPDTLPSFENNTLNNDAEQKLEKFYDRFMQVIANRDEQLMTYICAQQDQQQTHIHMLQRVIEQNDKTLTRVEHTQEKLTKDYHQLSQQLIEHSKKLTKIVARQQQLLENNRNRSPITTVDPPGVLSVTELNESDRLSTDIMTGVAATTILLVTMVALFRNN